VLGDAMLCVALVMIVQIDQLINGTLYSFGLVFNDSWAQPYWLMLRGSMIMIIVAILLISVVELPVPAFQEKAEEAEQVQEEKQPEFITEEQEQTENLTAEEVEEAESTANKREEAETLAFEEIEETELTANKPLDAETLTVEEVTEEPVSVRVAKKRD